MHQENTQRSHHLPRQHCAETPKTRTSATPPGHPHFSQNFKSNLDPPLCFFLMVVTSEPRLKDVTSLIHATRSPGHLVFMQTRNQATQKTDIGSTSKRPWHMKVRRTVESRADLAKGKNACVHGMLLTCRVPWLTTWCTCTKCTNSVNPTRTHATIGTGKT